MKFEELRAQLIESVDNLRKTNISSYNIVDMILVAYIRHVNYKEGNG